MYASGITYTHTHVCGGNLLNIFVHMQRDPVGQKVKSVGLCVPCRYSTLGLILLFSFATVLQAVLTSAQYDIVYAVLGRGFAVSHKTVRRASLEKVKEEPPPQKKCMCIYIYIHVYFYTIRINGGASYFWGKKGKTLILSPAL